MTATRRGVVAGLAAAPLAGRAAGEEPGISLSGHATQGGALIGRAAPRADIRLDGETIGQASARGLFIIGFDRDAKPEAVIGARMGPGLTAQQLIRIAPVDYDVQRVNGLPQDTVTPTDPELLARIAKESERKRAGFASRIDADDFRDGFDMPLSAIRVSSRFGGQRILNGTPSTPHYGADLAAPVGTLVSAPCAGVVSFAETGLHYEGGLIMLDHGQGLITAYLHLSKVVVEKGQRLDRGQKIGEVGMEGRATGPHLCWRMKWRARNCDPTLLVGVKAP